MHYKEKIGYLKRGDGMNDKVAIVTGGAQGIGNAIALKFLENGMRVTIADIDEEAGAEAIDRLKEHGDVFFVPTDVAQENQVQNMVIKTVDLWGRVDSLVNNAGIAQSHGAPVTDLTIESWNRIIGVNLTGTFLCTKYVVPQLKSRQGSIVNISSTRAVMSEGNTEAYSASKGGILALTHALAISLGPSVRVNCISPGWIDVSEWKKSSLRKKADHTPEEHSQHPAGRIGRPEDVAALAFFLISPEARFITGANFVTDGGMLRKMYYV